MIELFVKYKANINAKDNDGKTPLHSAVENAREKFVWELLKNKADRNIKENKGKLPIDLAFDASKFSTWHSMWHFIGIYI